MTGAVDDNAAPDWREPLLRRLSFPRWERLGRNPIGWPGYQPAEAVRYAIGDVGGHPIVACVWDFSLYGGSFGEMDASAFTEAVDRAIEYRQPLVSLVRSGGVRLQEGMAALVGMPRAQLALRRLAAAGVAHIAVADAPTTGGVFVSVVTRADLRVAIDGATVGFAGPRVAAAVTGAALPPDSHTATAAYECGLVDAVVVPDQVVDWLAGALRSLGPDRAQPAPAPDCWATDPQLEIEASQHVTLSRTPSDPSASSAVARLITDRVPLRALGGDETVVATVGRLAAGDQPAVGVALAARRGGRPTPAGYRLLTRAAELAGRLDRVLVVVVDTPGAEPGAAAEAGGIAGAIGDAMDAVLHCPAPTLAVVIGEGGSGGALAGSVTDTVLMSAGSYFAALVPEGAAAALRMPVAEATAALRLLPADLHTLGFADVVIADPDDETFVSTVVSHAVRLGSQNRDQRLAARRARWSAPLPGQLS